MSPIGGYRLSISATGSRALKACLPDPLFEQLTNEAAEPSRNVTFFDHRLNRLLAMELPHTDRRHLEAERPIDRMILRRLLLKGLDDVVRFGKKFVSFDDGPDGQVNARFADGSMSTVDLLVGATAPIRPSDASSCRTPRGSRPESSQWAARFR